jgi:hypothetical protein
MVALRAWYDPDDDEPTIINTVADVDTFLDRLVADSSTSHIPPLMQLSRREPNAWAVLHIGVHVDHGVITHTDATGTVVTTNGTAADGSLTYDYMGHLREVPANAEIPLPDVCRAVHEFVTTNGHRPTTVEWQPAD